MKLNAYGIALIVVIAYLSYHAIAGEQGLSSWTTMQAEVSELTDIYETKLNKKQKLQAQIHQRYPESLDVDYLEELARKKFHFVYPDEFVMEPPRSTSQLPVNEELLPLSKN